MSALLHFRRRLVNRLSIIITMNNAPIHCTIACLAFLPPGLVTTAVQQRPIWSGAISLGARNLKKLFHVEESFQNDSLLDLCSSKGLTRQPCKALRFSAQRTVQRELLTNMPLAFV